MKKIIILIILVTLAGCKKKHDGITGNVTVNGKITDIVSFAPIEKAIVQLIKVEQRYNGIGYSAARTEIATYDTTDALGNFSVSFDANGEYEFDLIALPVDPLHVNSDYTVGQDNTIQKAGSHIINLRCHRSAYAEVTITNIAPVDTPYFLSLTAENNITLKKYYKDTLVYLKLVGRPEYTNSIRFNKNNQQDNTYHKTVGPWDTIPMLFEY